MSFPNALLGQILCCPLEHPCERKSYASTMCKKLTKKSHIYKQSSCEKFYKNFSVLHVWIHRDVGVHVLLGELSLQDFSVQGICLGGNTSGK